MVWGNARLWINCICACDSLTWLCCCMWWFFCCWCIGGFDWSGCDWEWMFNRRDGELGEWWCSTFRMWICCCTSYISLGSLSCSLSEAEMKLSIVKMIYSPGFDKHTILFVFIYLSIRWWPQLQVPIPLQYYLVCSSLSSNVFSAQMRWCIFCRNLDTHRVDRWCVTVYVALNARIV